MKFPRLHRSRCDLDTLHDIPIFDQATDGRSHVRMTSDLHQHRLANAINAVAVNCAQLTKATSFSISTVHLE